MSDLIVVLRLTGSGPSGRVRAWIEALGRVDAGRRLLQLADSEPNKDLRGWCSEAGVEIGSTNNADVVAVAAAHDLPTPGALHRLVAATSRTGEAHRTRVLPWGATVDGPDEEPTPAPAVCVAFLAGSDPGADRSDVRRLDSAAVFTDQRSAATTTPVVTVDPPPYGHPAALPATALHQLLRQTGLPTPDLPSRLVERPFLTVLTRTQGTRLLLLEETLTCLAGQSSRDFEVVLACHRVAPETLASVRALVATLPPWVREQTTVLEVDRPGRSAPLNAALDIARGRYAVMLDDDDAVSSDWVAAFAEAEVRGPGTVLRSAALAQDVRPVPTDAGLGPAPVEVGPARQVWPPEFNLVDHLWDNASPPMTFAVPRGVFTDLGHRFDEGLDTTEDWDFLLRAAILTGVTSTPALTAAYRVWTADEGSRHLHDESHWARGRETLLRGVDEQVAVLGPGAAQGIRDLHQALLDERAEKFRFAGLNVQAAADLVAVNEAVVALRARISQLEERLERQRRRRQND